MNKLHRVEVSPARTLSVIEYANSFGAGGDLGKPLTVQLF
jgi:hypothetical protein